MGVILDHLGPTGAGLRSVAGGEDAMIKTIKAISIHGPHRSRTTPCFITSRFLISVTILSFRVNEIAWKNMGRQQRVGDEPVVRAEGSQREPEMVRPRQVLKAGYVHGLIVTGAQGGHLSTDY
jgi:hypothetical protein